MNRHLNYILRLAGTGVFMMAGCAEDPEISTEVRNNSTPEVVLLTGVEEGYEVRRTATTITLQGEVASANGSPVERYGLCWGTESNPTVSSGDTVVSGKGVGQFSATAVRLESDREYHLRLYATNEKGTGYGDEIVVSTSDGKPVFSSFKILSKDYHSAEFIAVLEYEGDAEVTSAGFCYSKTNRNPTKSDNTAVFEIQNDSVITGKVDGLETQTTYYVRAFAENSFGISYNAGEPIALYVSRAPTVITNEIRKEDLSAGTVSVSGVIQDKGESDIEDAGFCWSATSQTPAVGDDGCDTLSVSWEDDSFSGVIAGLRGESTYYVRAYATNAAGTSYGEVRTVETPDIITPLADYAGESVTEASSCVNNGIGYVSGGDLGEARSNALYAYDGKTDAWQKKTSSKDGLKGAAFVTLNKYSILRLGGKGDQDKVSDAFSFYSIGFNEWRDLESGGTYIPLYDAAGISIDDIAYFFGGSTEDGTINSKIWEFNSWTLFWSEAGTFPEGQMRSVVEEINDTVFVGLGMTKAIALSGAGYSKKLWAAASSDMSSWEERESCPTEATGIVCGTSAGGKLYALDTDFNMWAYDPGNDTWTEKGTSFASALSADNLNSLFMFTIDSYIYIGMTAGSKTFIKYDPQWDN